MDTVISRRERARRDSRAKPQSSRTPTNKPSDDEIRVLAYCLYERRCEAGIAGDAAADWLQAERQLASSAPAARSKDN
jgi:hypothetical protein